MTPCILVQPGGTRSPGDALCPCVPRAGQLVCSALHTYLDAGLGAQRAHQAVQCVKAQLDVEASLLLSRDVCDTPAFYLWASTVRHLLAAEVALGLLPHWIWADPKLAVRVGVNLVGQQGRKGVHMEMMPP